MKKQNFLHGALILMLASIIVKVFGAIFKIPLTNIIGVTSMAYFNTAYGFYVVFYMISTAGIPVALSKMISSADAKGNGEETKKIFSVSYKLFFIIGAVASLIMIVFSKAYSDFVQLSGLEYSIYAISITLFFICITSAYRGYFQGLNNMFPTAISQIIGAVGKLVIGIIIAIIAVNYSYPSHIVSALTLLGITVGTIVGTFFLSAYKKKCDKTQSFEIRSEEVSSTSKILKELISIAIPITLSATIVSLTSTIDTTLMVRRMSSVGVEIAEAKKIMGAYTSMAVPLNNLSPNLVYPFAISIIPTLSALRAKEKYSEQQGVASSVLRLASIITLPCSLGLSVFARPIISLLYSNKETINISSNAFLATDIASKMLSVLAISIFFISIVSVTNALLQAYGKETKTIVSSVVGILLKLVLNYVLIGNESYYIYGAPIASIVCYAVIMIMNFYFLYKYTPCRIKFRETFLKPIFSSVIAVGIASFFYVFCPISSMKMLTVLSILIAVFLYFFTIFSIKGIKNDDILMLPKGETIEKTLLKLKLLK